jgi:hypothetical protein
MGINPKESTNLAAAFQVLCDVFRVIGKDESLN